ncbi:MAG: helix-turn-helix domain-containing protein [Gaiella sp.]
MTRLLTTREVAALLTVHPECVLRWWRAGRIGGYRLGGNGPLRFTQDDVSAFLNPHRREPFACGVASHKVPSEAA